LYLSVVNKFDGISTHIVLQSEGEREIDLDTGSDPAGGRKGGKKGKKETKRKEGEIEEDGDRAIERAKTPPSSPGRQTDRGRTGGEADGNESLVLADRR